MSRVVLDTSVVVAAFRSRHGASNRLLRAVAERHVVALATTSLFLEYEAVLMRPEHMLVCGLDVMGVDLVLASLAAVFEPVETHFRWRPQLTDPADEMVLEAAINGRAEAIVTFNVRHFTAAARFGISAIRPADALQRIPQ